MNKIATLIGCAIGDFLGKNADLQIWDGQYTSNTLISMALSASLIEHEKFLPEDVAQKYLSWYQSGNTRGLSIIPSTALANLESGVPWEESGLIYASGRSVSSNSSVMRAAPIGLVYRNDLVSLLEVAMTDASITHNSHEPKMGACAVALAIAQLANEEYSSPTDLLYELKDVITESIVKHKLTLACSLLKDKASYLEALAEIGNNDYIPETVGIAFYCFGATSSFTSAVMMAVKSGSGAGSIVGALAGTYYGLDDIPEEYKNHVEHGELLQDLTDELLKIGE